MNLLLTNDDGYDSEGLKILAEYLSKENNVYIVAPSGNRSAVSNGVTFFGSTNIEQVGKNAWSCSGLPADCTALGLQSNLLGVKIDAVVSGINIGPNLGTDIVYSGTCAAARQAVLVGVPGIAVSLDPVDWEKAHKEGFKFNALASFVAKNIELLVKMAKTSIPSAFVNVNAASLENYKGVKCTSKLCNRKYSDRIEIKADENGRKKTIFVPDVSETKTDPDTDLGVCRDGYIVLSTVLAEPVCLDVVDGIKFSL